MIDYYYVSGSPFSWRVQLTLEEKGLDYELHLLSASQGDLGSVEHLARSPHGKVPAITDGELTLYESTAIVEYLEDRYPERPLMPADASQRAQLRIEELECVLYFWDVFRALARQLFFTPEGERDETLLAQGRTETYHELRRLEARCGERAGDYIMGETVSRADLAWLPFIEIAGRAGIEPGSQNLEWIASWRTRMRARPAYEKSYPPHWRN